MNKRRKVKSFKHDSKPTDKLIMRLVAVRPETVDEKNKSIQVVIATETPVDRYDDETGEVVKEILDMDGVTFRTDKHQLPIVDSHNRSTIRNVVGSVRDIEIEDTPNRPMVGWASFARDGDSQDAFNKVVDGHLTDFSITADWSNIDVIQRGDVFVDRDGNEIDGPVHHVTDWTPTDASLVAAGADVNSTARNLMRSYTLLKRSKKRMDENTKTELRQRGMPDEIENTDDALAWLMENVDVDDTDDDVEHNDDEMSDVEHEDESNDSDVEHDDSDDSEDETERAVQRALKDDQIRRREILALGKRAGISRAYVDQLCNTGVSLKAAREKVLERMIKKQKPIGTSAGRDRVEVTASRDDKFIAAMGDALIMRALSSIPAENGVDRKPFGDRGPAPGSEDFQHLGLRRCAEEILRFAKVPVHRLTAQQIAMVALGHRGTIQRLQYNGILRADHGAYHTTGIFPNLMLDAANKSLLAGYDEAEITYTRWARVAASSDDLKEINRIRFSESPDLAVVPENTPYPEGKASDSKESYKVEKFGRQFTVSWETVVNDDLDAISRIPQMHGASARRTQNKHVYAVLSDNANMADGTPLFDAAHSNLAGAGAVISTATLNAAYTAMRTQTGLDGETIIMATPAFLIVPAAIEATAYQILASIADPSVGGDTTGSSGVANIYGPTGRRRLTVVADPYLDGSSTTAWYLATNHSQLDTVEISFLTGEESPVLENEWDFDRDVYKYKIRQTFGVKAIDWRGLYKNPGA